MYCRSIARLSARRILLVTAAGVLACGRDSSSTSGTPGAPEIAVDSAAGAGAGGGRFIIVRGLSDAHLRAVREAQLTPDEWQRLFRLFVAGGDSIPIAGRYSVADNALHFVPMFPLDAGREYAARFQPDAVPALGISGTLSARIALPAASVVPSVVVSAMRPSADTVPENLLRIYLEFSAPMSRTSGLDYVHLLDGAGNEVPAAFLPLDADFWNADATRFTLFLDPGRVKTGILPHEQLGRALTAGSIYTIVVDSTWLDARGAPLSASFRRSFRVGAQDETRISLTSWRVGSPKRGVRDTLVVSFPKTLDSGLLLRAIGVLDARGESVRGEIRLTNAEREWRFVPDAPWGNGKYNLLVLSILEDPSGNRIDRTFEVDMFERTDSTSAPERHLIPIVTIPR